MKLASEVARLGTGIRILTEKVRQVLATRLERRAPAWMGTTCPWWTPILRLWNICTGV